MEYNKWFSLEGKKAMVIGGGGGLGQAIAEGLAAFGADVAIASRNMETLKTAASEIKENIGKEVATFQVDVSSEESVINLVEECTKNFGNIDILVNSQGYNKKYPLLEQPVDEWDTTYAINVRGMMLCCREFGRGMVERRYGRIINIGSVGAFTHSPSGISGAYSSSKGAVHNFTTDLAVAWGKYNVTVNEVAPILTPTKMTLPIFKQDPAHLKAVEENNPMGRLATPLDTVAPVIFFASDAAGFVNGQYILPDGGLSAI